ncbi:hypothetical protein D9M69_671170 [compost metagenome]
MRLVAEQHEAIGREVCHTAETLAAMQVEDFQLQLGVVTAVLTTIIHGGSLAC